MRRWLFRLLFLVVMAGLLLTLIRRRNGEAEPAPRASWPPLDDTDAADRTAVAAIGQDVPPSKRWSDPVEKACPPGFEVKVKLASGIYHLPGMFAYDRTIPDRCYASAEAAEADGFRAAKR
jgi:hypothetical protein